MTSVLCALGVRLGLFARLAVGPATSEELAGRAKLDERYVREWLYGLSAAGYLDVDRANGLFSLPAGLAPLVVDAGPANLTGGYALLAALTGALTPLATAFRSGQGIAPDDYPDELYEAMEQMSASWLDSLLVHQWLPAVDGLVSRLQKGARVADIGCGGGRALVRCAEAFPNSEFVGYDTYEKNVERARKAAENAGVAGRVSVVHGDAAEHLSGFYDLVTAFDVVHDAPDPPALLRRIRNAIDPDGIFLLLESNCADSPLDNVGPPAVILFATSVLYCLPTARAEGGPGLGTLGLPPARVRDLAGEAGFRLVRPLPVATPFNALYEARP
jgi:SAM-dependent methyltransferase